MSFGSGGEIRYTVTVDARNAAQQLQSVGQQFQTLGQSTQQATQEVQQLPRAMDQTTRSTQSMGSVLKNNVLALGNVASGIIGLISQYTQLQRAQNTLQRTEVMGATMKDRITGLQQKLNDAILKYGKNSQEAAGLQTKLNIAQDKYRITGDKIKIMQEQLNERMADFAVNILPSLIQTGSGIVQVAQGFASMGKEAKASQGPTQALSAATTSLGRNAAATWAKILGPIAAVIAVIELAKHNIAGLGQIFTDIRTRVEQAFPALKGFFDVLVKLGESVSAIVEGRFGDLEKLWSSTPQTISSATDSTDEFGNSLLESGKAAATAKKELEEFQNQAMDFMEEVATSKKGDRKQFLIDLGVHNKGHNIEKDFKGFLKQMDKFYKETNQAKDKFLALEQINLLETIGEKWGFDPNVSKKTIAKMRSTLGSDFQDMFKGTGGKEDIFSQLGDLIKKNAKKSAPEFNAAIASFFEDHPGLWEDLKKLRPDLANVIDKFLTDSASQGATQAKPNIESAVADTMSDVDWQKIMALPGNQMNSTNYAVDTHDPRGRTFRSKDPSTHASGKTTSDAGSPFVEIGNQIKAGLEKATATIKPAIDAFRAAIPSGNGWLAGETTNGQSGPHVITGPEAYKWLIDNVGTPISQGFGMLQATIQKFFDATHIADVIPKGKGWLEGEKTGGKAGPAVLTLDDAYKWYIENVGTPLSQAWGTFLATVQEFFTTTSNMITSVIPKGKGWLEGETTNGQAGPQVLTIQDALDWFNKTVFIPMENAWDQAYKAAQGFFSGHNAAGAIAGGLPGATDTGDIGIMDKNTRHQWKDPFTGDIYETKNGVTKLVQKGSGPIPGFKSSKDVPGSGGGIGGKWANDTFMHFISADTGGGGGNNNAVQNAAQLGQVLNVLARVIVQITKDISQWARATVTQTKDNNTLAKTIVQITKDNNTYAKTIVTVTKDINQWARATVTQTKDNNQLARTIVTTTKDNNVYAKTIVQVTKDINQVARATVQWEKDNKSLAESLIAVAAAAKKAASAIRSTPSGGGGGFEMAQHGMHKTLTHDTMILAHQGERVDIGPNNGSSGTSSSSGGSSDGTLIANFRVFGNDLINEKNLTKRINLTVGANRDKFGN